MLLKLLEERGACDGLRLRGRYYCFDVWDPHLHTLMCGIHISTRRSRRGILAKIEDSVSTERVFESRGPRPSKFQAYAINL